MSDFLEEKYNELINNESIDPDLFDKYNVKKGLRNNNGTGVLVGLTRVAEVSGYNVIDNIKTAKEGNLYYRGYDISYLAKLNQDDFGYERVVYLLLFGKLPTNEEYYKFKDILSSEYDLPSGFVENIILPSPSRSLMNHIMRCILSLYSYDPKPDDINGLELLKKGISLIAKMPSIVSYSLQAKTHYLDHDSLHIHFPKKEYSFAENLLYMSRNDGIFTDLEAKTLDMCLMVHADHGGGNNSAFVGTVVASTGTDLYSMITSSMASLKGPKHGGANMAVLDMMKLVINEVGLNASDEDIIKVINRILNKDFYDNSGLIYGIGHAIYTKSDPRCTLLREKARRLAEAKGNKKFEFYHRFELLAIKELEKRTGSILCANVDFYSGLIYEMLGIPRDLFIPIFAASRVVGWVAHDIEANLYNKKIVRPATKYVGRKEDL